MKIFQNVYRKLPLILSLSFFLFTIYWFVATLVNAGNLLYASYSQSVVHIPFLLEPMTISFWLYALANGVILFGFLLSTRVKLFEHLTLRRSYFLLTWLGLATSFLWLSFKMFIVNVLPFIQELLTYVDVEGSAFMEAVMPETNTAFLMMMIFPLSATFILTMIGINTYQSYRDDLDLSFKDFKWTGRFLEKFESIEKTNNLPDVKLGRNLDTKEYVVQPGKDRTLNNIIIGSIGSGKTATLALPLINQDLHHITRFINDYPKISQREDYDTEDVKGSYLNGISIIEPSNDLCQKAYKLVKAHGIPDESITYINPLDPNTPNFNPMKGPVETVAEAMAQVIEGLNEAGDGANFFFEQSQRSHLKEYVYLLKMHDEEKEVTFDMLLDMYNNPQVVRYMHEQLKKRIPDDIDSIEDRDEYNKWKIIQQVDEWFDMNLLPVRERGEAVTIKEGKYRGQIKYYDAKAEFVQGLRNILNDIGANPLIRRVLFGKSEFDMDAFLEKGGILLCNTAKGEMQNLSNVLGKIVLLSLQNAVFRRKPDISPYHHILVDEAPDYLYQPFREFPSQSRKYKCIITVICQTIAQMADRYGEHYLTTLIGTLRHRMVYGDVPAFDAEYFSKMFGEEFRYEEQSGEQVVSPLQDNPMVRQHNSYQRVEEERMSSTDIMFQDAFECAVKVVQHNRPLPVQRIAANFVPYDEFEKSKIRVKKEAAKMWLEARRSYAEHDQFTSVENSEQALEDVIEQVEEDKQQKLEQSTKQEIVNEYELPTVDYDDFPKSDVQYHQRPQAPLSLSYRRSEENNRLKDEHDHVIDQRAFDTSARETGTGVDDKHLSQPNESEQQLHHEEDMEGQSSSTTSNDHNFKVSEPPNDDTTDALLRSLMTERDS
ncbi:type IV secretory system conjugative DNA transfer family protein [Piscibacillus sp. B03]|uniref:type IV secretory system conjugative DNA transfer family protein n=1 Tax=Piscibacillus sp. B03 TaxID=3457430 RepID=UPI003FCCE0BB